VICAVRRVRRVGRVTRMGDTKRNTEFWWGKTAKRPLLGEGAG
jgi:hypothetical protein